MTEALVRRLDAATVPGYPQGRPAARRLPAVLGVLGGLLLAYLVTPFLLGLASLDTTGAPAAAAEAVRVGAVGVSVATATVATVVAALFGIPMAYVLARVDFPGKRLVTAFVYLPLVIPPLAAGLLLLSVYGPYAPVGAWFEGHGMHIVDAWPGIVLAQVFVSAPFLIVAAQVAFEAVDPALERTSYTLGVPPWSTFFRVSLPLAWPGILLGLPLTWLRALGEFGATMMLAYHPYSLPVYLFVQFGAQGLSAALPVAAVLAILGFVALTLVQRLGRRIPPVDKRSRRSGPARRDATAQPANTRTSS